MTQKKPDRTLSELADLDNAATGYTLRPGGDLTHVEPKKLREDSRFVGSLREFGMGYDAGAAALPAGLSEKRKRLGLAAFAAGLAYPPTLWLSESGSIRVSDVDDGPLREWDPEEDSADCLELVVRLQRLQRWKSVGPSKIEGFWAGQIGDAIAATRLSIVAAAARVGAELMK